MTQQPLNTDDAGIKMLGGVLKWAVIVSLITFPLLFIIGG